MCASRETEAVGMKEEALTSVFGGGQSLSAGYIRDWNFLNRPGGAGRAAS